MVIVTTQASSTYGPVALREKPDSRISQIPVRVSRRMTLDGGVVVVHGGQVHGDRTFRIQADITAAEEAALKEIAENETLVNVATMDGMFSAAIEQLNTDGGRLDLTLLVKEKLT